MTDEARQILRDYCKRMEEKHGPNWKEIKAKELAEQTAPTLSKLLEVLQGLQK